MTSINPSARFAIVPVLCDSLGCEVIPVNAIAHGPMNVIMERVLDSRSRNDAIELTKKAAKAIGTLESYGMLRRQLASREDAVTKRENTVTATLLHEALEKLDALTRRMDAFDLPEPEPIVFPPGYQPEPELEELTDEEEPDLPPEASPAGDLHVVHAKNGHAQTKSQVNGHATDGDGDEGPNMLPRSPAPQVEDPEMGSEPEQTLPPDPVEDD